MATQTRRFEKVAQYRALCPVHSSTRYAAHSRDFSLGCNVIGSRGLSRHAEALMSIKPADYPLWLRVVIVVALSMLAINLLFFLGPLSQLASILEVTSRDLGSWLGSLFSTFIGAFLAFKFGLRQRDRERVNTEVTAGNLALSTLIDMWDRQIQFQRDMIVPFRNRHDAWLNLPVGSPLDSVELALNRNELAFLLQADGATWQAVVMEDRRFHLVKRLIEKREDLILKDVWPRLAAAGLPMRGQLAEADMERLLGPAIVQQLRVNTAAIISMIDENVASSFAAVTALGSTLRKIHPGRKFIGVKVLAPVASQDTLNAKTDNGSNQQFRM